MIYQIDVSPEAALAIRKLSPEIKKSVKEALRSLSQDPHLGAPLKGKLEGLWKYRVRRYRVVYDFSKNSKTLRIYAVGHRKGIYDALESKM